MSKKCWLSVFVLCLTLLTSSCGRTQTRYYPPSEPRAGKVESKPEFRQYQPPAQVVRPDTELTQRMHDIDDLRKKVIAKKDEVNRAVNSFNQEISVLKREIVEQKTNNLNQALQNPRTKYNLILIQQKMAYAKKLGEVSFALLHGEEELLFLYRKTEGDLRMVSTLDREEINQLIRQIDQIINRYLPFAEKLVIDINNVELEPLEKIWKNAAVESKEAEEEKIRNISRERLKRIREGTFLPKEK